jgi:hypothetical protein
MERVFEFPKYFIKILLGDFNVKAGKENILNRQFEIRVYTKLLIWELEQQTLPHLKNLKKYHVSTSQHLFTSKLGRLQMEEPRIILTIFW